MESLDPEPLNTEIAAKLPEKIRQRGYITVATDPIYPPYVFYADNNKDIIGMDPEIGRAIGQVLGLELRFEQVAWAGVLAGVQTHRYDMSLVSMFDTPERQKQVDFVNYYKDGSQLIVQKGNPHKINDLRDICGHNVSVLQGSTMLSQLENLQKECEKQMQISIVPSTADQVMQIQTKRAVATIANGLVVKYIAENQGISSVEILEGKAYQPGIKGMGFAKDNAQLRDAVQAAMNEVIKSGKYTAILQRWGAPADFAIQEATINGGVEIK
ncbi:Glutamine-binding periplasmic protein precursor [Micromonospora sp. MW-13]|nr:Glutamine-binding periplasmic protein precursor [Micromonospora sp. MW-13]